MTTQAYYELFSKAMKERKIVRYENSTSRDDYHTYAIRETGFGHIFFCLLETFFRTGKDMDSWINGSLKTFHQFHTVKGATAETLCLIDDHFVPVANYKENLPAIEVGEKNWITVD